MKQIVIASLLLIGFHFSNAQAGNDTLPSNMRLQTIPDFTLMVAPDSIAFNNHSFKKHQPVMIILFSPDCEHCKHFTKELLANYDLVKKAQIVMASALNYDLVRKFYDDNKIANYPAITMGRDANYTLGLYYKARTFPTLIIYDSNGKYVEKYSGEILLEIIAKRLK